MTVTSEIRYVPRSPEMLRDATVRQLVAECERLGQLHCQEEANPGDPRTRFTRGEDDLAHVFVLMQNLEPGRSYECRFRWFAPKGGMVARAAMRLRAPSGVRPGQGFHCASSFTVKIMETGLWRVEVSINGEVEAERTLEVVGVASAQGRPSDSGRQRT